MPRAQSSWCFEPAQTIDPNFLEQARTWQANLTKPAGSLGRIEHLAESFCGFQRSLNPTLDSIRVVVFAADHGIAGHQVSAFPQAVTGEMLRNFAAGGAAISVLSRHLGAKLDVVNLGTVNDVKALDGVHQCVIAPSSADATIAEAMTEEQLQQALLVGRQFAEIGADQLLIGGDMGIGNSASAAAIYCALMSLPATACVGPGTGVHGAALAHKIAIVERALDRHQRLSPSQPMAILRSLGGFEIAALVGFYIAGAQRGIPLLIDGFITTAAAFAAAAINPSIKPWLVFSHCSAEPAHRAALEALGGEPLLELGLRLGEASGAALAVPLIRSAIDLHNEMATFSQAGVSHENG